MWYSLRELRQLDNKGIQARVVADASSPWFAGHFPDKPILPGIAQLKMVADVISQATQSPMGIWQLTRIKFKKIIVPGEELEMHITPAAAANQYTFHITSQGQDTCSGAMVLAEKPNRQLP